MSTRSTSMRSVMRQATPAPLPGAGPAARIRQAFADRHHAGRVDSAAARRTCGSSPPCAAKAWGLRRNSPVRPADARHDRRTGHAEAWRQLDGCGAPAAAETSGRPGSSASCACHRGFVDALCGGRQLARTSCCSTYLASPVPALWPVVTHESTVVYDEEFSATVDARWRKKPQAPYRGVDRRTTT